MLGTFFTIEDSEKSVGIFLYTAASSLGRSPSMQIRMPFPIAKLKRVVHMKNHWTSQMPKGFEHISLRWYQ